MFGSEHRLYESGAQGQGQVVGLTSYGNNAMGSFDYGVKVRAKLPDGSVHEFEKGPLGARGVDGLTVGSVVPVRYDPDKPKHMVLDIPALRARQASADSARQTRLDAQFEQIGSAANAQPPATGGLREQLLAAGAGRSQIVDLRATGASAAPTDPVAKLEQLAQLRRQGLLSEAEFAAAKATLLQQD